LAFEEGLMEQKRKCCDFCGRPLTVRLIKDGEIHYLCQWCGTYVKIPLTREEKGR